jgi:hypothetical protein
VGGGFSAGLRMRGWILDFGLKMGVESLETFDKVGKCGTNLRERWEKE